MSQALMQSTQIGVSLSLTIVTKTDNDTRLDMAHLADVTRLVFWLWSVGQWVNQMTGNSAIWAARMVYTVDLVIEWLAEPVEIGWLFTLSKTMSKTLSKTPIGSFSAIRAAHETVNRFLTNLEMRL